jgi:caffeoyl-CoA O-methyltransferase
MQNAFKSVDQFVGNWFAKEDKPLSAIDASLKRARIKNRSVSSTQGKFLQLLALLCHARQILEIGTLAGYSTIWLARALPKNGRLVSIESNPDHAKMAHRHIEKAGVSGLVEIKVGAALDVLSTLSSRKRDGFDMIFIDANKDLYTEYFEWALKLAHAGSLIVADNVVLAGKILKPNPSDEYAKGARRFLRALAASKEVSATVIQTVGVKGHDGMALAVVL